MPEDVILFRRLIFISVLSMQFHPRNETAIDDSIDLALSITERSMIAYERHFREFDTLSDIPF